MDLQSRCLDQLQDGTKGTKGFQDPSGWASSGSLRLWLSCNQSPCNPPTESRSSHLRRPSLLLFYSLEIPREVEEALRQSSHSFATCTLWYVFPLWCFFFSLLHLFIPRRHMNNCHELTFSTSDMRSARLWDSMNNTTNTLAMPPIQSVPDHSRRLGIRLTNLLTVRIFILHSSLPVAFVAHGLINVLGRGKTCTYTIPAFHDPPC